MKFLPLFSALALLLASCTTLSNRRDLYNPSEDAGSYNSFRAAQPGTQMRATPLEREEPLPPPR